ncbi:MAG: molybdopterin molybdotransferase MoeA [Cetobacterium sp.]|uniref:molybdopterin molybdotransferase MoeA n=2 Tax=Cetobacterium sp. TaxID=2071632 RepID=UPI002FCA7050
MKFFKTVSLDMAFKEISNKNNIILKTEKIEIENSLGRILAEDIYSELDLPSFNRSTVDGYAVKVKDVFGASDFSPVPLNLKGTVVMGQKSEHIVESGSCVYIPTGGMLPEGADGVVMIEDCEFLGDEILINKGISNHSNLILKGSEIQKNQKIISKGERITSGHIGVLASIGRKEIEIFEKIKFSIISTGDEVVPIGSTLKIGEVYDINTHIFSSLIEEGAGEVVHKFLVKDSLELLSKNLKDALEKSHVVLISGGSSVGMKDFTEKAIESIGGEIFIHGMAIKPGKPTIVATYKDKFIFGMPGHPQSGVNVFRVLVEKIFLNRHRTVVLGKLTENLYGDPGKTCFVNVSLLYSEDGIKVQPFQSKSSMIRPVLDACGFISIPEHREGLYAGEIVEVILNGK